MEYRILVCLQIVGILQKKCFHLGRILIREELDISILWISFFLFHFFFFFFFFFDRLIW